MKKMKDDELNLRITLEGEMLNRFKALKRRYGINSGADLVRLLITQKYDEIRKEEYFTPEV